MGLYCGSRALANDIVAACLAAHHQLKSGLVMGNGEFDQRLVGQAERAGLTFEVKAQPWDVDEVSDLLAHRPDIDWIRGVPLLQTLLSKGTTTRNLPLVRGRKGQKTWLQSQLNCTSESPKNPIVATTVRTPITYKSRIELPAQSRP